MDVRTELYTLDELFRFIEQGRLRIPAFQRPYVWAPRDMLDLLDSVERGFPIGGVLIWRTWEEHDSMTRFGPLKLPDEPKNAGQHMYLLDGHQRLATLFGVLKQSEERPPEDGSEWWWWMGFDPTRDQREGRFFHIYPDGKRWDQLPKQYIPARYMLNSRDFLDWMDALRAEERRLKADGGRLPAGQLDALELTTRGQQMMSRLLRYKLPVYFVEDSTREEAALVFERLNRKGVQLTEAELQSALLGRREEVDLNINVISAKEQVRAQRFETLSDSVVLSALLATATPASRFDGPAQLPEQRGELAQRLGEGLIGFKGAAWFLHEGVELPGARWLPDSRLLLLFVRRFALNAVAQSKSEEPALVELFWTLALSGLLDRLTDSGRKKLVDVIVREARGDREALPAYMSDLKPQRLPQQFAPQLARVRAHLLIQRLHREPLTLEEEPRPMEIGVLEDQLEDHRGAIFTRAEAGELYRDVGNQMWHRPTDTDITTNLWLSQTARLIEDEEERRRVLESHAIDEEAWEALGRQDARAFIEARRAVLRRWEVEFLRGRGLSRLADGLEEATRG